MLTISSDLQGRTIMFRTAQEELVAVAEKPVKTLILNAALGVGSELQLVVAPGVDCRCSVHCIWFSTRVLLLILVTFRLPSASFGFPFSHHCSLWFSIRFIS